ncbi:MAG: hypothetical protein DHS20C18_03460 [Saprospiraceae bacterium]|nr:MAG: hypothetical protein DHS20C18_03460 [Saprospiraceae bacterium]
MKCLHATMLLVTILYFGKLNAQTPQLRWGKVSDAEWEMTYCDFDSAAPAIILLDKGLITFEGSTVNIERHRRIKIFSEEGFDYANIEIPFYHRDKNEWITNFSAHTLVLGSDGKVEKIKVKDEYTEQRDDFWSKFKFAFSAVGKGVIIEYSYRHVTKNFYFLEPWEFQQEIPVLHSELNVIIPNWLNYSFLLFGKQLSDKYGDESRTKWVLEKQPGYKDEAFVYNPKDYINQIQFQLHSYFNGSSRIEVLRSWEQLGKEVSDEYRSFFRQAARKREKFQAVTAEKETELDKAKSLFNYFRKAYQWNGYFSIYPKRGLDELLETGKGSSGLINLWLIGAFRAIGMEADPVLISTRFNGKVVKNFPLLSQFNTVLCRVICDGTPYLLDIVERGGKLPFDLLPVTDLNYSGLVITEDSTSWIDINPIVDSRKITLVELNLGAGTGKLAKKYRGYPAAEKRQQLILGEESFLAEGEHVEAGLGQTFELSEQQVDHLENFEEPLKIVYNLKAVPLKDNKTIYFTPFSWSNLQEVKFKKKERDFPVELEYPFSDQLSLSITVPEGYVLEEAPKDILLKLPGDAGQFIYRANNMGQKCLIDIRLKINEVYFVPEMYFHLKEFFELIKEKISESLVFKAL